MSDPEKRLTPLFAALAKKQAESPWLFVIVALLTLIPAAWAASGLKLKQDFAELLPENKDSVIEAKRVRARLPGASTLTIVAETTEKHPKELEAFVDALVPKLHALGPEWVGQVDHGVHATRAFFDENKLLFAKLEDLEQAHKDITERYDYEVGKRAGTILDEDDAPPPVTAESIKRRLRGGKPEPDPKDEKPDPHPDGYYRNQEGTLIAVLVRTPVSGTAQEDALRAKIEAVVAETNPRSFAPDMTIHYTGNLITGKEEYEAIVRDLGEVGLIGVTGVLASVFLFFLRVRVVLTMGGTLLVALLWTFGLTRLSIGFLNNTTGFLVSIIAGNGINYGIMYMARYIEARRDEHLDVAEAIRVSHRDTWIPTLASSATAMLAYGSLVLTDFRGFKHFGIIGGYGMIFCWVATYVFTPAILAASERVLPSYREGKPHKGMRLDYGWPFEKLAFAAPRLLTVVGGVLLLVSLFFSAKYFLADPMEYDMTKVRNERKERTSAGVLQGKVDGLVGRLGQDGLAIVTDRLDQVPLLEIELEQRRAAAPPDKKPFEQVVTIFSLLPKQQVEKIPLVNEMRDRILRARQRGFIEDKDWVELEPQLPKAPVHEIGIADLPEQVARSFTEKDGTRGRIVYIVPTVGESVWDGKYLIRWADSFRKTTLPNGEIIKGSGQSVIFADMIQTVGEDAPRAIIACSVGSILIILVAFRGHVHSLGVFVPWLLGLAMMVAFLYLDHIKLNFLNFVALPITVGIGAEYAHNLMQRYRVEGRARLGRVIREAGGAVILCSLTTVIGYLALLKSINRGIVGFGLAAAMGEITCIAAAVLVLPAYLVWRGKPAPDEPPRDGA